MNKLFFLFLILFTHTLLLGQTPGSDSLVIKASQEVLNKKFDFSYQGGKLAPALSSITASQKVRFSYSDSRIDHVYLPPVKLDNAELSAVLYTLLKNTGLSYLMVGRIVVIVQDIRKDTASAENRTRKNSPPVPRIYSEDRFMAGQPEEVKREIRKKYAKELAWSRKNSVLKDKKDSGDSTLKDKAAVKHQTSFKEFLTPFYVKAELGVLAGRPRFKNSGSTLWQEELEWKGTVRKTAWTSFGLGFTWKRFSAETGLGFYSIRTEESGVYQLNYNVLEPRGNSGKFKVTQNTIFMPFELKKKYSVVSIPFRAFYALKYKKIYLKGGPAFQIQVIKTKTEGSERGFQSYYVSSTSKNYESHAPESAFAAGAALETGFMAGHFSGGLTLEVLKRVRAYYSNPFYNLKNNPVTISLTVKYHFRSGLTQPLSFP